MDRENEHEGGLGGLALLGRDVPVVHEQVDDGARLAQLHDPRDLEPPQRLDRTCLVWGLV